MKLKRFVAYLYEYTQGQKMRNTGFIRVDVRGNRVGLEVCVQNYIKTTAQGKLYGLVWNDGIMGVALGEVEITAGHSDRRIVLEDAKLGDSEYVFDDMIGIALSFENEGYLASCWSDAWAEEIAKGLQHVWKPMQIEVQAAEVFSECEQSEEETMIFHNEQKVCKPLETTCIYKKIPMEQIAELPKRNGHLLHNSFLMHGVFNYGYLFLKKEADTEKERLWLGVPGYFEKPEMLMAVMFGFSEFEPIPKSVVDLKMGMESEPYPIEKNQEPKIGIFGGWFLLLEG